jgi:transcriptional regulator with XRE-family HTH domain
MRKQKSLTEVRAFQQRLTSALSRRGFRVAGYGWVTQAAKKIGVSAVNLGNWHSGRRYPDPESIQILASGLGVDPNWLSEGFGEMETSSPTESQSDKKQNVSILGAKIREVRLSQGETIQSLATSVGVSPQTIVDIEAGRKKHLSSSLLKSLSISLRHTIDVDSLYLTPDKENAEICHTPEHSSHFQNFPAVNAESGGMRKIMIPRLVDLVLGPGGIVEKKFSMGVFDVDPDWIRAEFPSADPKTVVQIEAVGDSMVPTIQPGSVVFIDINTNYYIQDGIYAIRHGGVIRIKRLHMLHNGNLLLKSDNPSYQTETLSPSEIETLPIAGRVLWHITRV